MVLSAQDRKDQATPAEMRRGSGLCISHALLLLRALLGPGRAVAQAHDNGSVSHGLVIARCRTQFPVHCWTVRLKLFRSERLTLSEGHG
jgi:hypothetical protein